MREVVLQSLKKRLRLELKLSAVKAMEFKIGDLLKGKTNYSLLEVILKAYVCKVFIRVLIISN